MSFLLLQHGREEFFDERKVAKQVHAEHFFEVFFRCIQDCVCVRDAGVVDEDGWRAQIRADCGGGRGDGGGGGDVAFVETNGGY